MDMLDNLVLGLSIAVTVKNILYCLVGALVGTLIGVLPGIGPLTTISMLLPLTFQLEPTSSLIMLAGIYYGAAYGGSTTSILVNLPGEASSVVTCLDGHQMARQGRAGTALAVSAFGSFFAGTVATFLIVLASPVLVKVAQTFGPVEYCSLMVLGLMGAVVLAHGSLLVAVSMIFLGLLIGLVGTDINSGHQRYTFGIPELSDGIDLAPIAMGLFGIGEIVANLERRVTRTIQKGGIGSLLPSREDLKRMLAPMVRGTAIGSLLGVLPGGGAVLASFASYALEKKLSSTPEKFGTGMLEGVAGPESANNAGSQTSFIPMLCLGLPSNPVMALMIGAMIIQGIQPGPDVMLKNKDLFWGLIASMWVGNLMLVIINLPLIGIWVKLLSVPYRFLYPAILLFCCIGAYSLANSSFHVLMLAIFGLLGYAFVKLDCEGAPFLLGLVLGPQFEEYLRRAMLLSRGDPLVFFTRPISLCLLIATLALVISVLVPSFKQTREVAFKET